jgi:hypothetical protein
VLRGGFENLPTVNDKSDRAPVDRVRNAAER